MKTASINIIVISALIAGLSLTAADHDDSMKQGTVLSRAARRAAKHAAERIRRAQDNGPELTRSQVDRLHRDAGVIDMDRPCDQLPAQLEHLEAVAREASIAARSARGEDTSEEPIIDVSPESDSVLRSDQPAVEPAADQGNPVPADEPAAVSVSWRPTKFNSLLTAAVLCGTYLVYKNYDSILRGLKRVTALFTKPFAAKISLNGIVTRAEQTRAQMQAGKQPLFLSSQILFDEKIQNTLAKLSADKRVWVEHAVVDFDASFATRKDVREMEVEKALSNLKAVIAVLSIA